jgi:hypothetical protein
VLVAGLAGAVHSPDVVLPALRDFVKRDEGTDRVRLNVLWPLRAFGRRAVPVLEEILSGPPGDVMEQACRALADVAPEHPWVLERLERAVTEGGNASEAEQILASMLELDRVPAGARALLRAASSRPELPLRLRAARVLLRTGGADETLLPLLREGLTDHWYADGPLYWRGPLCNPARREAVRVLAEIGPAGKALLPELRACLEYPDGLLRLLAAEALWKLTGELRVEVLLEALDKAVQWRLEWPRLHEILPILTAAGPAAREAAPYLEPLLASPFLEMERERVQAALAAIRGGESPATE